MATSFQNLLLLAGIGIAAVSLIGKAGPKPPSRSTPAGIPKQMIQEMELEHARRKDIRQRKEDKLGYYYFKYKPDFVTREIDYDHLTGAARLLP
jgi:hypothetical protein